MATYININTRQMVSTRPGKCHGDGGTIHNPTDDQLVRAGWRLVRNVGNDIPVGHRQTGVKIVRDTGRVCDVERMTEADPYQAERATYMDANKRLTAAIDAVSIQQAVLALADMVRSLGRVVNNEVGR